MTMCNLYHDIESTSTSRFFFERSIVIDRSRLWRNRNNTSGGAVNSRLTFA